jgi:beta-lactamase superfamily II metal-dependent hydrolase
MSNLVAPKDEEIEISIFGPGYGECILIHVPGGDWFIVDSCINSNTKNPAAIDYLSSIGVDLSTKVKLIVATHWHDDHIRGLSDTVKRCSSAELCFSSSLENKELIQLATTVSGKSLLADTSGIDEFHYSLVEILSRGKCPIFAGEGTVVWKNQQVEVHALSPSHYSRMQVALGYKDLLPQYLQPKKALIPTAANINHIALVLLIKIGDFSVLLGSDLEDSPNPNTGWSAIVSSTTRPQLISSVFKIPHHGSENGHSDLVWQNMLQENPLSLCTPYNRKIILPRKSDVARICEKTTNAHITATIKEKELSSTKDSAVEKTIKESGIKFRPAQRKTGHVRCRFDGSKLLVDHFNGAGLLSAHQC